VCVAKNLPCGYLGEEGQSRIAGTASRLESLENIMAALRTRPLEDAEELLRRIRTDDGLVEVGTRATNTNVGSELSFGPAAADLFQSDRSAAESGPSAQKPPSRPRTTQQPTTAEVEDEPGISVEGSGKQQQKQPLNREPSPGHINPEAVVPGQQQRSLSLSTSRLSCLVQIPLPDADVTQLAIDSFFNCSGKVFHVFSKDEISECYHEVFSVNGDRSGSQSMAFRAKLGAVMAVAAVGSQYLPDEFRKEVELNYYNLARYYFECVMEQKPIHAIKICTLLAQYNIFSKATISLSYVAR
jgi:hypothetical protein